MKESKDLLKIAKRILDINPNACLTGTLMLKVIGIDIGREPHDIDILISDYAPNIKIPEGMNLKEVSYASDGSGIKYKYKDIVIDILSDGEQPVIYKGMKLGTLEGLMKAKLSYSKQINEASEKHKQDLIKLGFKFPKKEETDDLIF